MSLADRTRYEPAEAEPRIFQQWMDAGLHHPEPDGDASENYSIAVPPPNVTGALHMGHALNGSIQDTLVRFARAQGRRAKWICGTDHAGIATQTQVERLLAREGTSKEEIGREAFEKRVWQWREQYGGTIIQQFKRLGALLDYEEERFTLDAGYVQAVLKVFVDLYDKGYVYRGNYMVNWDPGSQSAISDLEVEEREVEDTLYSIDYPLEGGGSITIATVRPETMLADTAIAVHPDDERYARLVGERAVLPLVGRKLKIIADPYVKPEFGTGALKITPGHDPNDFEIGRNHGLEEISVIGEDGRMTEAAGDAYAGMTVMECRDAVVSALRAQGLISRTEPYVHNVPYSQRSGERIEPLISLQWFMDMDKLARPAIDVVRDGRVRIFPEGQHRRYLEWMENIRPWCISRQLWWGHRIPVYYRGEEETYVGLVPPEGDGWEQDPDVLDTWFSSALWPFATLGWPEQTPELRAFYPTNVLLTARDILFLWVARMVMMGIEFLDDIPFEDVYVHSVVQAPDGRRMSKSLGTGIDPLELISGGPRPPVFKEGGDFPAYGADAVRYGLLAMSSTQDFRFNEEKIAQGSALANKLFNASRLVMLSAADQDAGDAAPQGMEDEWILSRLQHAKQDVARAIEEYAFHRATSRMYDFVYGELCDWYLEMIKPRLRGEGDPVVGFALHVLRETLTMCHPVIPFVTEEIWSLLGGEGLLAEQRWPATDEALMNEAADVAVPAMIETVQALRAWRDRVGAAPGKPVPASYAGPLEEQIARLARLEWVQRDEEPIAVVRDVSLYASDAVDMEAEAKRTEKLRDELKSEIRRVEAKLANEKFVAKAPEHVVAAEREKLERLRRELEELG